MMRTIITKILSFILIIAIAIGIGIAFLTVSHNGLKVNINELKSFVTGDEPTTQVSSDNELIQLKFDKDEYPAYYTSLGDAKLTDDDYDKIKELEQKDAVDAYQYSDLDHLDRSGDAIGIVSKKAIEHNRNQGRPSFKSDADPSGWPDHNPKVKTGDYKGYLWNRSHSIAWSLGGSMERTNLTTGTRSQNVGTRGHQGGMKYPEEKVMQVAEQQNMKVYYKVQPMYKGDELIPRGSKVTMYSIDDDGASLNESVWVFNQQDGVKINYAG